MSSRPTTPPAGRSGLPRAIIVIAVLQVVFVLAFVVPGHNPKPNQLPVGIVGAGPPAAALQSRLDARHFDVHRFATLQAALRAIDDREVYGAFDLVGARPTLTVASAASASVAQLLATIGQQLRVREVRDAVPLSPDDPRGTTINLLILPLIVTSLLGAQLALLLVGPITLQARLSATALVGAVAGLASAFVVHTIIGALPGPFLAEAGLIALAVIALLLVGGGLIRMLGAAGLGVAFAIFLMLGNPASGAASAPELLPTPWSQLGHFLVPGALANGLRNTAYFDGVRLAVPVIVLLVTLLVGIALEVTADRRLDAGS